MKKSEVLLKIQNFEKALQRLKEAFKVKIIPDDEIVLDMLEDRNRSSHIYDEKTSEEIFERIKNVYIDYLKRLNLQTKI